ncbi:MAG: hypothetical protein JNJ90_18475 [Saprospiraceae bacterium]|nr:hypothetical protein [Saprospiraceae bacterium]
MIRHDEICKQLHTEFLERWPLEAVHKMTLGEYNSLNNSDSFCAWLERRTKPIGIISGRSSTIFDIFERHPWRAPLSGHGFANDERYTWRIRHGSTAAEAFASVRNKIVEIISLAQAGDLEAIERLEHYPPLVRWKIAFLYAPSNSMLSIFVPAKLHQIGHELGVDTPSTAELHRRLAAFRPVGQGIYSFAFDLWHRSSPLFGTLHRKYYIIGTKYGAHATDSRAEEMKEKGVVATDFGPADFSIESLYLDGDKDALRQRLEENMCPEPDKALPALFTFLNIRVGDIVALKDSGQPKGGKAFLKIIAYAVVVEREGRVYQFDESLGHCLQVEYLATNLDLELEQGGYGKTVSPVDNLEAREKIFGEFFDASDVQLASAIEKEIEHQERDRRKRKGVTQLSHKTGLRKATLPAVINHHHLRIQSELLAYLRQIFPHATILGEENYIDICVRINNPAEVHLYEVKPYVSVRDCIRAALGQLLDYARQEKGTDTIRLIAVGPTPVSVSDRDFVAFIQQHLTLPFEYKCWRADFNL